MRELLAAALLVMLALPARADIVDSGSLIIGGQGVIGGTFTVQGNALGVAGALSASSATLSASGANIYSLTTSSGIHLVSGVLEWPDGSKSTTASPGGISAAVTLIASSISAGGGSSVTFSGLSASTTYRLEINMSQLTSAGYLRIQFNSDTGSNYAYSNNVLRQDAANSPAGLGSTTQCELENTPNPAPSAGDSHFSTFQFSTIRSNSKKVQAFYQGFYSTGAEANFWESYGMCRYSGASNLSSVTVFVSGGNFSADIRLFKIE